MAELVSILSKWIDGSYEHLFIAEDGLEPVYGPLPKVERNCPLLAWAHINRLCLDS